MTVRTWYVSRVVRQTLELTAESEEEARARMPDHGTWYWHGCGDESVLSVDDPRPGPPLPEREVQVWLARSPESRGRYCGGE